MEMTVGEIAALVGGEVVGDPGVRIRGVNGIKEAKPGDLTFVRAARYMPYLKTTLASAVLLAEQAEGCAIPMIIVGHPDLAFAQVLQRWEKVQLIHPTGIHPTAVIAPEAQLGAEVAVDAHVRIAEDAVIGDRVVLYAGCYVGRRARIGADTVVYPNVVLREDTEIGARCIIHGGAVIGGDGFGFAPLGGQWMKIPQVGRVVIEDDVEIGSNTTIDRATFGETRVRRGTKIDNLVQIGHNTVIGEHCALAGMAGVSGSVIIGDGVRIGAAAGIAGHLDIGAGATVGARSGVHKSVGAGKVVTGYPAIDHELFLRVSAAHKQLPELIRRMRSLERQVQALEKKLHERQTEDDC